MSPGYLWKRCPATARDAEIDLAPEAPPALGTSEGPNPFQNGRIKTGKNGLVTCFYMFSCERIMF